jgi:chromosome segregation ATPase
MIYTEKLLEDAKAAIDEITRLTQLVQDLRDQTKTTEERLKEAANAKAAETQLRLQTEGELNHLKASHAAISEELSKESARATSLQHEVDRLRQKLVGPKSADDAAAHGPEDRYGRLEAEVGRLRRSVEQLRNVESPNKENQDEEDDDLPAKKPVMVRLLAWFLMVVLGLWLLVTYLGLWK